MDNSNRTKAITLRLTPDEYQALKELSSERGLSVSDFIRTYTIYRLNK